MLVVRHLTCGVGGKPRCIQKAFFVLLKDKKSMDCFVPQVGCLTTSIFICGLWRSQAEKTFQQWTSSSVTKDKNLFRMKICSRMGRKELIVEHWNRLPKEFGKEFDVEDAV